MQYQTNYKQLFVGLLLPALLLAGVLVGPAHVSATTAESSQRPISSVEPEAINPKFIFIPKLSVATVVESVGTNDKGEMAVPDNWRNASWYQPGVRPGENGHAVFAAHRDWGGNKGPFYNLPNLSIGDNIFVSDGGIIQVFTVTSSNSYDRSADPQEVIFRESSSSQVTLVTCEGQFLDQVNTYADRRLVQAELTHTFQLD
jgi:LPXTG-site transpeptidase (sortase) family protein